MCTKIARINARIIFIHVQSRYNMQKKLTITIEEGIYNDLHLVIGKGRISKFIEKIIKPYVTKDNLRLAYQTMSKDEQREKEACDWEEGLINNDFS